MTIIENAACPRGCIIVHPDDAALLKADARERGRFETARMVGLAGRLLGTTEDRDADIIPFASPAPEELTP